MFVFSAASLSVEEALFRHREGGGQYTQYTQGWRYCTLCCYYVPRWMCGLASGALDSLNRDSQGPPSGDDASGSPPPPLASRPACCTAQRSNSSATSSFPFALAQSNACKEPDFC